jgi:hypothetical protein
MSNNALAFLQILFSVDGGQLAQSDCNEHDAEQRFSVLRLRFSVGEEQLALIRIAANVMLNSAVRFANNALALAKRYQPAPVSLV